MMKGLQRSSKVQQAAFSPIIGTVKGPGETGNQYVLITTNNQQVKIGEFVYYSLLSNDSQPNRSEDETQQILGKICKISLIDRLPDRLLADPETSPEAIAALLGFTDKNPELYEVTVETIGYFHPNLGFINPRQSPHPGAKVMLASDRLLQSVINRKDPGAIGSAHVGSILLRQGENVPVVLDVKEIVSTHLAILAGTGSGKSYTAGVLIEELLSPHNRAPVLIFDPHGEYGTLEELRGHADFTVEDYSPQVKILMPDDVRIRMSSLDYYDILMLLPTMSDRQQSILSKAFRNLNQNKKSDYRWDVQDLIAAVYEADSQTDDEGNERVGTSAPALGWKLEKLERSPHFHAYQHLAPQDLFEPGQVTVLQMNEIAQEEQQVICAAILRQAYQARMNTQKEKVLPDDENYLPFPVFILVEEAHRFAPAHEPSRCKAILRTILSEGRKFGLGVGLITQRPGKIDSDVLSQCMSQFLLRIINPVDQDSLKHGVEAAGRDLLNELPALTKGQAIIAGACVNTPVLCRIRKRLTRHGGNTLDAPDLWQRHFAPHRQQEREASAAPPATRETPQVFNGRSID